MAILVGGEKEEGGNFVINMSLGYISLSTIILAKRLRMESSLKSFCPCVPLPVFPILCSPSCVPPPVLPFLCCFSCVPLPVFPILCSSSCVAHSVFPPPVFPFLCSSSCVAFPVLLFLCSPSCVPFYLLPGVHDMSFFALPCFSHQDGIKELLSSWTQRNNPSLKLLTGILVVWKSLLYMTLVAD